MDSPHYIVLLHDVSGDARLLNVNPTALEGSWDLVVAAYKWLVTLLTIHQNGLVGVTHMISRVRTPTIKSLLSSMEKHPKGTYG